jgi:hypothetical protein
MVAGTKTLARVTQKAELNGEPEAIHAASVKPDECQVFVAEQVMSRNPHRIGWNGEKAVTLVDGQQGAAGHENLAPDGSGHFISRLPFEAILKEGIETRNARNGRGCPARS